MTTGCSQTYRSRSDTLKQQTIKDEFEIIDSSIVIATVKPINYEWNTDTTLTDLTRYRITQLPGEQKYPNPFSPATQMSFGIMKSDSISFYICNKDESSCYKFQEGFFEKGYYTVGFQKLNIKTSLITFKIETSDTTITHKYIFKR